MNRIFFSLILVFTSLINANSQTKIATMFGDHMVLQRNTEVNLWGTDKPKTKIEINGSWGENVETKSDKNGKWMVKIPTKKEGGPYTLKVKGSKEVVLKDILLGEVWICTGQSNMAMTLKGGPGQHLENSNNTILNSSNFNLRFFTVKKEVSELPKNSCKGNWEVSSPGTAVDFSAVGYYFGSRLQKILNVPVGLISSNVGGTPAQAWTPKETILSQFPEFKGDYTKKTTTKTASVLYNGMIHPMIPYTIKGAIWYQGEGNKSNPKQYAELFPAVIKSWRTNWNQGEFPFYFVQLAPFGNNLKGWVGVQQAQLKTMLTTPNTGMVVINDLGYKKRIHPPKKKEVGERLSLWALSKTYGLKGIQCSGPIYKSSKIEGNKIIISFNNIARGITSMGKELNNFEIIDAEGRYHEAKAKITKKGAFLEVWSTDISNPKGARYAWKSYVEGSLFNTAGLPASSFTTENWDRVFK